MTTNAKFEKWYMTQFEDDYNGLKKRGKAYADRATVDMLKAWQAALSSPEVTPELVMLARIAWFDSEGKGGDELDNLTHSLNAVFAAIKEGKA